MVSTQALAGGEPVSLATTLVIAVGYATLPVSRRRAWRVALLTIYGIGAGCLLAAIQYVPLGLATQGSARSLKVDADFWTFHPLALIELLVPHFFGDYFNSNLRELAWMIALNSGRDPFYYTRYIGVPIAMLAGIAMVSGRQATRFWTVVVAALRAGVGRIAHTPVLSDPAGGSAAAAELPAFP